MSGEVKFTVLVNDLPKIKRRMVDTSEKIVAKTAMDLEATMKSKAPVDTGNLKNSIQAVKLNSQAWRVIVGAEYGAYVEYGTVHTGPQPFFMPAVTLIIPQFRKAWEALVSK